MEIQWINVDLELVRLRGVPCQGALQGVTVAGVAVKLQLLLTCSPACLSDCKHEGEQCLARPPALVLQALWNGAWRGVGQDWGGKHWPRQGGASAGSATDQAYGFKEYRTTHRTTFSK